MIPPGILTKLWAVDVELFEEKEEGGKETTSTCNCLKEATHQQTQSIHSAQPIAVIDSEMDIRLYYSN